MGRLSDATTILILKRIRAGTSPIRTIAFDDRKGHEYVVCLDDRDPRTNDWARIDPADPIAADAPPSVLKAAARERIVEGLKLGHALASMPGEATVAWTVDDWRRERDRGASGR